MDAAVAQIREDRHILAAILCGSLSHDEVWDKSDIDLVLVCADDKKTGRHGVPLLQDDVNIHTTVQPRADFRRRIETAVRNTFEHSLFAKGRLLFSRDSSIDALLAELKEIGARDSRLQAMRSAQLAILTLYKARKWHAIKDDPAYTALWILNTARALAEVEVGLAGELVGREALTDALRLNPRLFRLVYTDLLERPVAQTALTKALAAIDDYLETRAERLFAPVLEYLDEGGGRAALQHGHRASLPSPPRRRGRDHRVRVAGGHRRHREGVHARETHHPQPGGGGGIGVLSRQLVIRHLLASTAAAHCAGDSGATPGMLAAPRRTEPTLCAHVMLRCLLPYAANPVRTCWHTK